MATGLISTPASPTNFTASNPNYNASAYNAVHAALGANSPAQVQDVINANGWTSADQAAQSLGIDPNTVNAYMSQNNLSFSGGKNGVAADPNAYNNVAPAVWGNNTSTIQSDINGYNWQNAKQAGTALGIDPGTVQAYADAHGLQWAGQTPDVPVVAPSVPAIPVTNASPAQVDLNAPKMSIAGNIGQYLDPNSTTNQMLKTKALEAANGVGTLNSSMTDSAISNGIIANAESMAAADQGVYATGAGQNANLGTQVNLANSQAANTAAIQKSQEQTQVLLGQMNNQNQLAMTNLNNNNKTLLQSSSAAQSIYSSALQQISAILANGSLDNATQQADINTIMSATSAQLNDQSALTGLNVGQYFGNYSVA